MERIFHLHGISSQQKEQFVGAVMAFMEIVYKAKLKSVQLNSLEKLDHVTLGGDEYTSFAERGLL